MEKEKDSIEKLDEQIKKLEKREPIKTTDKEQTTKVFEDLDKTKTKVFDSAEIVESSDNDDVELLEDLMETKKTDIVEEKEEVKEVKEEVIENTKVEIKKEEKKKNNKNRNIIIGLIIGILLVVVVIITCLFVFNKDDNKDDEVIEENIKLTEKEKEELIKSFGEALEGVINIYYSKQGVLLEYEDALKLVEFEEEINCEIHDIYKDGKVYLDKCSINGIKNKYSYGEIQLEIESSDELLNVYVEKASKKVSLEKPTGSTYDTYTVHCGSKYSEAEIVGDYVIYYDSEYVLHMKNYKTDEVVLKNLSYQEIWPIRVSESTYDSTYLLVKISNFWGVYNYITGEQVISPMYTNFLPYLSGSVGNPKAVDTIGNNKVVAWNGNNYGVINYTTNKTVIPFDYITISLNGDYIWARDNNGNGHIFDEDGNTYLENTYDKVFGIVSGNNVLVLDKESVKLVNVSGDVKYNYGKIENMGDYNFGIYYNNQAIFQFADVTSREKCIEVIYDPSTKEGSSKQAVCGGLAKPILYLYPEEKTKVMVTFEHPEYLETTYPKFTSKWIVDADTDGTLTDENNKKYYALYWDEKKVHTVSFDEGFYVEKDNAIDFLEKKLSYIGLNDKEMNEFIMYWLPILEKNEKSLVYFELTEERDSYNKINISPKPDSLLRVAIHIKKVDKKVNIKKQSLKKFKRKGFVAVEWGGMTY